MVIGNDTIKQELLDYILNRTGSEWHNRTIDYNTNVDMTKIKKHIVEGKKVLLMAHSQGSLYSNLIYRGLNTTEKSSVGLLYVGAASSHV
jgi:hypothetical protein